MLTVTRKIITLAIILSLTIWGMLSFAAPAQAATHTVTDCSGESQLRDIIENIAASGDTITFACGADTIPFNAEISIDKALTIDGGAGMTFDGGDATYFFYVTNTGNVTFTNVTMQNGQAVVVCSGTLRCGGAIFNDGGSVTGGTFIGNSVSSGSGGAIYNNGGSVTGGTFSGNSASKNGGAVLNFVGSVTESTFSGNSASNSGGAIYNNVGSVTGGTFSGNSASNNGGAVLNSVGSVTGGTFIGNSAFVGGGAIYNNGGSVTGGTFTGNSAEGGGAILNSSGSVTNSKIIGNTASLGGDGIFAYGDPTATNNCIVGNEVGFEHMDTSTATLTNNWWGTSNGPSGLGSGDGDAIINTGGGTINFDPWISLPIFPDFECPTVIPDLYSTDINESLTVAAPGVLANDIAVKAGTAALETPPSHGSISNLAGTPDTIDGDGSFIYTPDGSPNPVDGFRYTVNDVETDAPVVGLVCITRTGLDLEVPGTQNASVGVPLPIPDVTVLKAGDANASDIVRVTLSVSLGTLSVVDPGNGDGLSTPDPAEECKTLLDTLRTASVLDEPNVVDAAPIPDSNLETPESTIALMSGGLGQRPQFVPYNALIIGPVDVIGNNTANVILEGAVADLNAVLDTLTYIGGSVGVDDLVIVANDATDIAIDNVLIIIGGQVVSADGVPVSDVDNDIGSGGSPAVGVGIPLGPMTLYEISQIPTTIIVGEAPGGTVNSGDVFVKVVVANGNMVGDAMAIGDQALLNMPLTNGAELFGLTSGGLPVADFSSGIKVCLKGSGTFYYRDATGQPRQTVQLQTTIEGLFTCAIIPNAGTVLLVNNGSAPAAQPVTSAPAASRTLPDGCMVTTRNILNLREAPNLNGELIRRIPYDVTLTALELNNNYYYVDYLGTFGWISADYVTLNDGC